MAEEELSIIEEEDAVSGLEEADEALLEEDQAKHDRRKKLLLIGGGVVFLLLLIIIMIMALSSSEQPVVEDSFEQTFDDSLERKKVIPPSELENMIKKANLLYSQGNKEEALALFKQIALHSESISHYNLGVARMKNKQWTEAIEAFKKAITQNDRVCIAAINAAVCALKMDNKALHKYYIDLADAHLVDEFKSPLYSYYRALINFYKDHHLEALSALEHPSSAYYKDMKNYLRAKLAFALNDPLQSTTYLEQAINDEDLAALGMMYARMGQLDLAKKSLLKVLEGGYEPIKNSIALAHVCMKHGDLGEAAQIYKKLNEQNIQNYTTIYPIKVSLNLDQFDLKKVQERYRDLKAYDDMTNAEILIHFAPYQIFDAVHALGYIKKGSAHIYIDDLDGAQTYLSQGTQSSKVNYVIAQAITDALNHHPYKALEKLLSIIKIYPKHSVLNYNIGLTYAKLGNLKEANSYFVASYNLDAKNYMAGFFAAVTGKLIGIPNPKQKELFKENLDSEKETADIAFIKALYNFNDQNYQAVSQWADEQLLESSFHFALMTITSKIESLKQKEHLYAKKLVENAPKDTLAHLIYMQTYFHNLPSKEFALKTLAYLKPLNLKLNDIFYGSHVTLKQFVEFTFATGHLYDLSQKLQHQLAIESQNIVGIMQGFALSELYLQKFESAFTLYNQLIDDYKQTDSQTLFYAALAATGGTHHGNAIALLSLANLKNRHNDEARFALALLQLESKNYSAASIQLSNVLSQKFHSEFFTFSIDTKSIGSDVIEIEDKKEKKED